MPESDIRQSDVDKRVRERAMKLWREAGRPASGVEAYLEEASELIAIEDNPKAGTESSDAGYNNPGPWGEPVEEAEVALGNEGEFPTTTDQGEQQNPQSPRGRVPPAQKESQVNSDLSTESEPATEQQIRERAYHLWVEEGRPHGRDQDHWERARREIEEEQQRRAKPTSPRPRVSDAGAAIDPLVKTKTAARKKPSLKAAAKSPRHS